MKNKKKFLIVFSSILFVILLLGVCYKFLYKRVDISKIDSDCEVLRKIFSEASIDIAQSIDEGLDIDETIEEIKQLYAEDVKKKKLYMQINENGIAANRFAWSISTVLAKKLTHPNGHLSITSPYQMYYPFNTYALFASDILFEKSGTDYIVFSSSISKIKPGMVYTGSEENLFKTILYGKILYRFGYRSNGYLKTALINVDGKDYKIKVKLTPGNVQNINNFSFYTQDDTLYVYSNTFNWHTQADQEKIFNDIKDIGKEIQNLNIKTIVFDLRHNTGGSSNVPYYLLRALVCGDAADNSEEVETFQKYYSYLVSKETCINTLTSRNRLSLQGRGSTNYTRYLLTKTDEKYSVYYDPDFEYLETVSPLYNGKIVIISDIFTGSSAEMFILGVKRTFKDNVVIIGQNTAGALDYPNVYQFNLNDSKDSLLISFSDMRSTPIIKESDCWEGDCKGIAPDYWYTFNGDFLLSKVLEFLQ